MMKSLVVEPILVNRKVSLLASRTSKEAVSLIFNVILENVEKSPSSVELIRHFQSPLGTRTLLQPIFLLQRYVLTRTRSCLHDSFDT